MTTTLKQFQQDAVSSASKVLITYLLNLKKTSVGTPQARSLRSQDSALLLTAPTGTGKTLIAGHVAQDIAAVVPVVWFWFTPYAGLTEQTEAVLRREFQGLQVRSLRNDRQAQDVNSGDVFVTTWALLSNSNAGIHEADEFSLSLSAFVAEVRGRGFRLGVIVDEAHHTFKTTSKAYSVYKQVLQPDITLLATATPNDQALLRFQHDLGLTKVHRASISRQSGVAARLLKPDLVTALIRSTGHEKIIDYRQTALRQAVAKHHEIKRLLAAQNIQMTPLLLVQVDSDPQSIPRTEGWLRELKFEDAQVRKHTADEPNPDLLADAIDENVEVIVFKMAVATGFDAPRAFTLCSMRAIRDPDFGMQIVGRISRIDRRLQPLTNLPTALEYGYVYLSDPDGQTGIAEAALKIKAIKDAYQGLTNHVHVFDGNDEVLVTAVEGGQVVLMGPTAATGGDSADSTASGPAEVPTSPAVPAPGSAHQPVLILGGGVITSPQRPKTGGTGATTTAFEYPLRGGLVDLPERFYTATVKAATDALIDTIVANFPFEEVGSDAQRTSVQVQVDLQMVFEAQAFDLIKASGSITPTDVARMAQRTLLDADGDGFITPADLEQALLDELRREFERHGWDGAADDTRLRAGLNMILALHPEKLRRAVSIAVNSFTQPELTQQPIPTVLKSAVELTPSRHNIYGVYPPGLNLWELNILKRFDTDTGGHVLWWHRNPVRTKDAVGIPVPGHPRYYPDVIVKVRGRTKGTGILLMEPKGQINDYKGNAQAKAQVTHPVYDRPVMIHWVDEKEWRVVEYDEESDQNRIQGLFDLHKMKVY